MKNLKLTIVFLISMCLAISANAQLEKGRVIISAASQLSGTFNKLSIKSEHDVPSININTFAFSPGVGYMFSDNFSAGGTLAFGSVNLKMDGKSLAKISTTAIRLYGKYYFLNYDFAKGLVEKGFTPYVTTALGMTLGKMTSESDTVGKGEFKMSGLSFGGGVGLDYFFTSSIGLSGGINYYYGNLKNKDMGDMKVNLGSFSFAIGLNILL